MLIARPMKMSSVRRNETKEDINAFVMSNSA